MENLSFRAVSRSRYAFLIFKFPRFQTATPIDPSNRRRPRFKRGNFIVSNFDNYNDSFTHKLILGKLFHLINIHFNRHVLCIDVSFDLC